ncbi:MAG: hypothetical protein ABI867_33205 [Kofleriaceae bacterium]
MFARTAASFALITGMALGTPAIVLADPAPVAAHVETAKAPTPAPKADSSDYAKRETQDKQVANYQGGSTVVIAMSGGVLVVILVLLLIL